MGPGPGPWEPWVPGRAQKVLGMAKMPEFPESSFKCLGTSEVTRTQNPRKQMRNEIVVWRLSVSGDPMTRKNKSSKRVVWTRSNGEIRKGEIIIISTKYLVPSTWYQVPSTSHHAHAHELKTEMQSSRTRTNSKQKSNPQSRYLEYMYTLVGK